MPLYHRKRNGGNAILKISTEPKGRKSNSSARSAHLLRRPYENVSAESYFSRGGGSDEMFHEFLEENIPQSLPQDFFAHIRLKNEEIAL